jgi:uncharacterized membrane protein YqjE
MVFACLTVLISLVLPTNVLPSAIKGIWVFYVIAGVAVLPVLAAAYFAFGFRTDKDSR